MGEKWYKILPRPTEAIPPATIKPSTTPTWKYTNPADLATSGIYTEEDLRDLREQIMFPVERSALLNDLAREIHGHPVADDEGTIGKLLNEDAVSKIVQSTWNRLWTKFMTFGTVSAGLIAILMLLQFVKIVVDILLRGYTLHSIFGWAFHLLGAVWSSITNFMLYNQRTPRPYMSTPSADADKNPRASTAIGDQPVVFTSSAEGVITPKGYSLSPV